MFLYFENASSSVPSRHNKGEISPRIQTHFSITTSIIRDWLRDKLEFSLHGIFVQFLPLFCYNNLFRAEVMVNYFNAGLMIGPMDTGDH